MVTMEHLRYRIKTKRKALQNKQGIPNKTEETGTLNKVHLLLKTKNLK
jgi:hypothetical protein